MLYGEMSLMFSVFLFSAEALMSTGHPPILLLPTTLITRGREGGGLWGGWGVLRRLGIRGIFTLLVLNFQHTKTRGDIMPRKGASGSREWRLRRLMHMEEYATDFLLKMTTPTQQFPLLESAVEDLAIKRKILEAEVTDGAPMIRHGKTGV